MADKRLYHKLMGMNPVLAAASGVLLALAFPKPGLFPLAWIGLVPLLVALRRVGPRTGFLLGLVAGCAFFLVLINWISLFGLLPYVLLCLVESLQIAIFGLLACLCYTKPGWTAILAVPALWTGLEWTRTLGSLAFPWGELAYSQSGWTSLIQVASITGPWGVSFLIVLANAVIAEVVARCDRRSWRTLAGVAALVVMCSAAGSFHIRQERKIERRLHVAMVQGGIDLTWPSDEVLRRIVETYWPMTEGIHGADLIVWPESALPGDLLSEPVLSREVGRLASRDRAYMLVGGYHAQADSGLPSGYKEWNGAYLIDPRGNVAGSYYKVHLVPFGEFVPGRNWLPLLDHYRVQQTDRTPGGGFDPMRARFGDIGTMICFESTFPQIGREYVQRGAGILVVITNDSWFGDTAAAAQHHQFAVFRAVETGRFVLRNATTGISSIIAPSGEVEGTAGLGKRAVVNGDVAVTSGKTLYVRSGDWFAYLSLGIGLLAAVVSVRKRRV